MKTKNCMNCRNHKDGLWCIECKYVPMDLVDVVRCKDCVFWEAVDGDNYQICKLTGKGMDANGFCSNAVRGGKR